MPSALRMRRNWSSTTSASAPATISEGSASAGSWGRSSARAARKLSSPWVKVVSMPLPRIVQEPHRRAMASRQPLRGAAEVELDHFRRAGANEHQKPDVGPPVEQALHHAIELFMHVGHAGKVALFHDGGREAWLGEDHHACSRLHQMGAGARSDDEEEGVLHLAVQPDDRGEAAEDFMLAAFTQRLGGATGLGRTGRRGGHGATSLAIGASRRAARSLMRNWPALTM